MGKIIVQGVAIVGVAMPGFYPRYLGLFENGELARRAERAVTMLKECRVCPRGCGADRQGEQPSAAFCRIGRQANVGSYFAHLGEENCLRGWNGSGTIFFSRCNLLCSFCQNFDLSWQGQGRPVSAKELARMMIALQDQGCHNINFVTPSHVLPQILEGLYWAVDEGLHLPLVYNTSGYDRVETLELVDGVIDIYMPDFKFWNVETAKRLAAAPDYPDVARAAIREMHRQVGDLVIDEDGLAQTGLLVRHLVMPDGLEETRHIMRFLAREISTDTYVNVMPQYRPAGKAVGDAVIGRPLSLTEYHQAVAIARQEGLRRLDVR